jgi:isopenicillin N synthase-like dioxygenase
MREKFRRRLAESHFNYGLFFIKKGRLSSAGWEFLASIGADAKRFFSLTLALAKRQYTSKRFRKCTGVISDAF